MKKKQYSEYIKTSVNQEEKETAAHQEVGRRDDTADPKGEPECSFRRGHVPDGADAQAVQSKVA